MESEVNTWQLFAAIVLSLSASSGFWAWIMARSNRKSASTQLLLGLAHDRITYLGMRFIERGAITRDEFEDFHKYLWAPYSTFGGNGLAEKIFKEVEKLPITQVPYVTQTIPLNIDAATRRDVKNEYDAHI